MFKIAKVAQLIRFSVVKSAHLGLSFQFGMGAHIFLDLCRKEGVFVYANIRVCTIFQKEV